MTIKLTDEGNTKVDEAVAHTVKINPKQRASFHKAKGKEHAAITTGQGKQPCDLDQQCDHEPHLQIIVGLQLTKIFSIHFSTWLRF